MAAAFRRPGDPRHVFGPSPAVALMPPAEQDGPEPDAGPYPQAADALWTVKLVRRHREQVDTELIHSRRDLPGRLHRVGVEVCIAVLPSHGHQVRNWLDGTDLVVRVHDAHKRRVRPQRVPQGVRIHEPVAVDRQPGYLEAIALEGLDGTEIGR